MNREQARAFITENPGRYLQPDKSGKGYICPICGSGSGKNGTGITTKDSKHFTCWAGCYTNSDIIDIIGLQYNITEYSEKLSKAAEIYGLQIDGTESEQRKTAGEQQAKASDTAPDYTAFYLEAAKNLNKTDYHTRRGLSQATAEYFKLGYVNQWRHPKAPTAPASPRLIIPTSDYSYIARDTRAELTEKQQKYAKSKVGEVHIFNLQALSAASEPVFITEGEIDAMSIYEAGGIAAALGGVSNIKAFAEAAAEIPQTQPYIIALDNDTPGKRASTELFNLLKAKGLRACELNPVQGIYKDANEALQADRAGLIKKVAQAKEIALISPEQAQQIQYEQANQASSYIEQMRADIEKKAEQPLISTGFKELDSIINGGLYPGLYFIGAVSSLGKTTLALQIADNVAKQGTDALIISLEMAKAELIAKSISRLTAEYSIQANGDIKALGQTTANILNLKRQRGYYNELGAWIAHTTEKKAAIEATVNTAYKRYSEYAQHIFIYEGIGDITPEAIRARIEEHRAIYGKAPVLIIDYLQIMAGESDRLSDKQKVDKGVVELKRISRDYETPVIAISSVNRASYDEPITMDSFKESGGIEFSSDILIGLQYKGFDYQKRNKKKKDSGEIVEVYEEDKERAARISELKKKMGEIAEKGELPQRIEVKILKNRNGKRKTAELNFYPMFNYFDEPEGEQAEKPAQRRRI